MLSVHSQLLHFLYFFISENTVLHCATEIDLSKGKTVVMKTGRTTGSTTGLFFYDSLLFRAINNQDDGRFYLFPNCYGILDRENKPFFKPGDSGSGIYLNNNNNKKIVGIGIAIARDFENNRNITFACKIQEIVEAFNIDAYTTQQ